MESATFNSPWSNSTATTPGTETASENIVERVFLFSKNVYSSEEIATMRAHCEREFELPSEQRPATDLETKIVLGLVHGHIVGSLLPAFVKRIMDTDQRARLRNTIRAQVEGELTLQLPSDFKVYAFNQTTHRLIDAIAMAAGANLTANPLLLPMLKSVKSASYNASDHAIHFFFRTRETAQRYDKMLVPIRNRKVKLINAHRQVPNDGDDGNVWIRQMTSDEIKNKPRQSQYRLQLFNVSRFVDTNALAQYFRKRTTVAFDMDDIDHGGPRSKLSLNWELVFHVPNCPQFLMNKTRINWFGTTLILHHLASGKRSPCLICGAVGHIANGCKATAEQLSEATLAVGEQDKEVLSTSLPTFTSEAEVKEALLGKGTQRQVEKGPGTEGEKQERDQQHHENPSNELDNDERMKLNQPETTTQNQQQGRQNAPHPRQDAVQNPPAVAGPVTPVHPNRDHHQESGWQVAAPKKGKKGKAKPGNKNLNKSVTTNKDVSEEETKEPIQRTLNMNVSSDEDDKMDGTGAHDPEQMKSEFIDDPLVGRWVKKMSKARLGLLPLGETDSIDQTEWIQQQDASKIGDYPTNKAEVLKVAGLHESTTPATGNCQFFAICSALAQLPLERWTQRM